MLQRSPVGWRSCKKQGKQGAKTPSGNSPLRRHVSEERSMQAPVSTLILGIGNIL
jgi:hypothetical protein